MHFLDASYVNDKMLISIKKQKEKRKMDSPRARRTLFWPFLIAIAFHLSLYPIFRKSQEKTNNGRGMDKENRQMMCDRRECERN